MSEFRLGVDIGGTFTDIILLDEHGKVFGKKLLSTPQDYSLAIQDGVEQLLDDTKIKAGSITEVVHGTTVATNAIIERKGVKVALITTRGFRDVLEIGRYRVPRLYDLHWRKPEPLVERRYRFEVTERMNFRGEELVPVNLAEVDAIVEVIKQHEISSIAVCFLHAYANSDHEEQVVARLRSHLPDASISASAQLMAQIQEYERTSTTVVNAYLRPITNHYVASLTDRLERLGVRAPLQILQSNGSILPGKIAADNPVYIIESGPAAGVVGGQKLAEKNGLDNVLVFDMGGTTAKASIVENNRFALMPETEVGGGAALGGHRLIKGAGYIVQVPTIDIAEVGAGGGSIAFIDPAGGLQVGPQSAGADPGPACYNRGGDEPTVTDANMLLGYLNSSVLVGGELEVRRDLAEAAVGRLGEKLGMERTEAAFGVHQIADSNMLRALKSVTVERGHDPANFTIIAIGGNGGVHGWGMAEALGVTRIIVPPVSGLFSALGMLFVEVQRESVRSFYREFASGAADDLNAQFEALVAEATKLLTEDGFESPAQREITAYAGMKYVGQIESLAVPIRELPLDDEALTVLADDFGAEHERTYGYRSDKEPKQTVYLKAVGRGLSSKPRVPDHVSRGNKLANVERTARPVYFGDERGWRDTPVVDRESLTDSGDSGPLIIEEYDCTTVVPPGWRASLDSWNNIVLSRIAE